MNITAMNKITEKIYLGDITAAQDVKTLKQNKITRVLSLVGYISPKYDMADNIEQKLFDINDFANENIYRIFKDALTFIDQSTQCILVHCAAGVSRSATIVIAYIMWKNKKKFEDALKFVQSKRMVFPNCGFQEQLKIFEKDLIKANYDINKINFNITWKYSGNILFG